MKDNDILENIKENKKVFIIIGTIIVLAVLLSLIDSLISKRERNIDVDQTLRAFAKIYYEDYYYPDVLEVYGNQYQEKLQQDATDGIKLTLRKIVNMFDNVDTSKFYRKDLYCDFVDTYVIVYPKQSYEKNNYDLKTQVSCSKSMDEE